MIRFKRQTNRSTREDTADNINIYSFKGFEFGIVTSNYWGSFNKRDKNFKEIKESHKPHTEKNPLIEISLNGNDFELTFEEFKEILRNNLKGRDFKAK